MNPPRPRDPGPPVRLGLVCPPLSGHLNPALALGRKLVDRGYSLTYFGVLDAERAVRSAGIEFVPLATSEYPLGETPRRMQRLGELSGWAALKYVLTCLQEENQVHLRELPRALSEARMEGMILDQIGHGAVSVAQHLGLPYATACHALALHADPALPPFNECWEHRSTVGARLRNQLAYLFGRPLLAWYFGSLNVQRRLWALPPLHANDQGESPLLQLSQQPAGFEFPGRRFPDCFRFTGPWTLPDARIPVTFPWECLNGRPLIYASLGTLQNRLYDVFRTIAAACVGLDAQLVISLGSAQAPDWPELPGHPLVVKFAPQLELLRRAHLVITHAGLNTTLESLREGVPLVAIPIANDQPGVASRVKYLGAGEFVPVKHLTEARLRVALRKVLENPSYRNVARRFQQEIAQADGLNRAADLVERFLVTEVRRWRPEPSI